MSQLIATLEERYAQLKSNREALFAQLQATAGAIGEIERLLQQAKDGASEVEPVAEVAAVTPKRVIGRKSRRQ